MRRQVTSNIIIRIGGLTYIFFGIVCHGIFFKMLHCALFHEIIIVSVHFVFMCDICLIANNWS